MQVTKQGEDGPYRFFYVTNRRTLDSNGPVEERFASEREQGLRFGLFDTDIEPSLGIGMLINPTDWFQNEEIKLREVRAIDQAQFIDELRKQVEASPNRSLLININGFREAFPSALRKTAFLAHVLDIDSPLLVFDWPGDQGSSPRGYRRAQRIAGESGGELESAAGQVEIVVIDSDDEVVLGQSSELLPGLQPGESREFRIRIASKGRPEPDVIIAAFARVGDLTAMNDADWLMLGDAEEEEPEVPIITDLDPPPPGAETLHFLDPPRAFIIDNSVCILITAYTSGGDLPEKLDQVVFEVVGGTVDTFYFQRVIPSRWSAMTTDDGLVAGKTFECSRPDPESYELLKSQDLESINIAVTLGAQGTEPYTQEFPLNPDLVSEILEIARLIPARE